MELAANTPGHSDQKGFCRHFSQKYYIVLGGKSILKSLKMMNLKLEGKTALVSGSAAGIGLAIATPLAAEGGVVQSIL